MLGTVKVIGADATANGGALVNLLQVTTSRGRLHSVTIYNSAVDQFIQFHDSATTPIAGAVPKASFPVLAGTWFTSDFTDGRLFINGIFIGNSTDATTYVAGAADCLIDATYRKDW